MKRTKINRNQLFTGKDPGKPRILVAPLDWGLGHTTRCFPVIYELLKQEADVWLAGEGSQEVLLRGAFPNLPFLQLQGYRVRYGRNGWALLRNLLFQAPRILRTVNAERKWLRQTVHEHKLDAIISDNRFGLYHPEIPSVIITHQLRIKSPLSWTEGMLQWKNYRYINQFSACWVPDFERFENSLAGELSHPAQPPHVPLYYTGPLSRLQRGDQVPKGNHLFISLSGPEPQRSMFENIIVEQISRFNGTATIVRGLPHERRIIPSTNDIRFYNHLDTEDYNREMGQAEWVISRSGYSTVMDIYAMGKKAILVPTPGQTEQEYLGSYLEKKGFAIAVPQTKFLLSDALSKARDFQFYLPSIPSENNLEERITEFLLNLKQFKEGESQRFKG